MRSSILFSIVLLSFGFISGCGGGNTTAGGGTIQVSAVSISVSPSSANVILGNTQQFKATLSGSSITAVSWGVNGVAGGNSTVGTISSAGLYTAPRDLPSPASVTITAVTIAAASHAILHKVPRDLPSRIIPARKFASGSASVSVTSDISVQVTTNPPTVPAIQAGISVQLTAAVASAGKPDQTINWSVNGIPNGNASVGRVVGSGLSAVYTAPGTVSAALTATVQATSAADTSKSSSVRVRINTLANQLTGAFNFTGPYPAPTSVTYTDYAGQIVTTIAYPGQIVLSVSPSQLDSTAVGQLVRTNGGSILAQIPKSGLYWVQVAIGSENKFISALLPNSGVMYAAPNVPLTGAQASEVLDLSSAASTTPLMPNKNLIGQIDLFRSAPSNDYCGLTHGAAANEFLEENGQGVSTYDVTQLDSGKNVMLLNDQYALAAGSDVALAVTRAAEGALQQGQRLIINLSLQPPNAPNDGQGREICETVPSSSLCTSPNGTTYASWKADEFGFLAGIAGALQYMPAAEQANTLVVVSAGNSGLDLTNEIALLRQSLPGGLGDMIVAGSLDTNGLPFFGHNFSTSLGDLLFAPGVDVAVPTLNGCVASGTSLAAPAVANLAAHLAQQYPTNSAAQIGAAVMGAAPPVNGLLTIPTFEEGATAAQLLLGVVFTGNASGSGNCGGGGSCPTNFRGTMTIQSPTASVSGVNGIVGSWGMTGTLDWIGCCSEPYGDGGYATFNVNPDGSISVTLASDSIAHCLLSGWGTTQRLLGSGWCYGIDYHGPIVWGATASAASRSAALFRIKKRHSKPRP